MATGLSPEDLEALAGLPALDAQEANLRRQLEMATQLRNRQRPTYSGASGSFFGGLANAIDERQAIGQQQGIQAQIDALLSKRAPGDAAGARLKTLMTQQGLEKGGLDMEATRQRMAAEKAEAERLGGTVSAPLQQMLSGLAPGVDVSTLTNRDMGTGSELARALSGQRLSEAELRERRAGRRSAGGIDPRGEKQLQDLGETISKGGIAGFYSQYDAAKKILDDPRFAKDLPGFGRLAGLMPDDAISQEGVALRQAIGQMLAEYRKGVTGAGMSDAERAEYGKITGLIQSGNEESVRQGVERLRESMDAKTRAFVSGLRPEVASEYGRRMPRLQQVFGAGSGAPTSAPGAPAGGMVEVVSPTGQRGRIPAANLEKALAKGYKRGGP